MNSEKEIEEKWKALTKMSATFMFIQEVISTEQFDEKLLLKILAINLADKLKEISKEVKELRAIAPRLFQDSRGKNDGMTHLTACSYLPF